ncbi:unnamed protein product [Clonostachys rosea f. rosea IK726]|uniref:Uncharacterized protein n=1 Tax=Clonostachys rosea f. rosea IK726 TaxID=1349383 RepID=A0ACA9TRA6_BIOOC|nr:unnamed protein product [Clonostachys rosea f. rosea IK726]
MPRRKVRIFPSPSNDYHRLHHLGSTEPFEQPPGQLVPAQSNRVLAQGTLLAIDEPRNPGEDMLGYIGDGAALPVVAALDQLVEILLLGQERVDRAPHHHPHGPHPQLIPKGGTLIQHQVKGHRVRL